MKIKTTHNFILFRISFQPVFDIKDLRMKNFGRISPSSVQIHTRNITSTVSINYSIDVYHGVNKNGKIFKKKFYFVFWLLLLWVLSFYAKSWDLIKNMFHKIRRYCLTRMLPGKKDDHFLFICAVFIFVFRRWFVNRLLLNWCDFDFRQIIARKCPSQRRYS